ncbi:P-loop containing nucleoside triphosphate hydrolase protein [Obelidium mucronatum]|nr:P-loop containing nucleoside triphosphate hydrolase protein [Obelidium mucronatum]
MGDSKHTELTPLEQSQAEKDEMPWAHVWLIDQITFSWVSKVIWTGNKKTLEEVDMWRVPQPMEATRLADRFAEQFKRDVQENKQNLAHDEANAAAGIRTKRKGLKPGDGLILQRSLWKLYFKRIFPIGFLNLGVNIFGNLSPLVISYLLAFAGNRFASKNPDEEYPLSVGVGLAVALFILQILSSLCGTNFFQYAQFYGIQVRTTMTGMIYRKSLLLSSASRQEFNAGRIVNMVSTDASRMEFFLTMINIFWTAPFNLTLMIGFLIYQLGWPALIGIAILVALIPIQYQLFKVMMAIRREVAPVTDKRVKTIQEMLQGIRLIKYFAWEKEIRKTEIGLVLKASIYRGLGVTIGYVFPVLAAAVSFVIYSQFNPLNASACVFGIELVQYLANAWADFKIALTRIEAFLLAEELEDQPEIQRDHPFALSIHNGDFQWEEKEEAAAIPDEKASKSVPTLPANSSITPAGESPAKIHLRNINLDISRGSLVAIVGSVGSGKSSLLNAIIGEMKKLNGEVIFSGDNILFGNKYDEDKYRQAIHACALEADLQVLPDGDQTSIGERGINLSGGQKQRVNLARLCYYDAEIALLDDPLSAVDAHVGRHLFDNCIMGALKHRTRILVTHQLHFLSKVDQVIVMRDGEIAEVGGYQELVAAGGEFSQLIKNYGAEEEDTEISKAENGAVKAEKKKDPKEPVDSAAKGKDIMKDEDRGTGTVKSEVWFGYIKALGGASFIVLGVTLLVALQGVKIGNDLWLSFWTSNILNLSSGTYIGIYFAFGVGLCLLTFAFGVFFAYAGTRAAKELQAASIKRIIHAPVYFFDTNPMGRVLNRFSKDQDAIDQSLASSYQSFATSLASTISTFTLIIYATPVFAVPLIPILGLYYFLQRLYRNTSRELKRLDSTTRSPLYANFGATLTGLPTIRAYGEQSTFIRNNDAATNGNNSPYFLLSCTQNWLGTRLQVLGSLLVFFAALFGVLAARTIDVALLGYALNVTQILNQFVSQFTAIEVAMNAVERVEHYANHVEMEAAPIVESNRPPKNWPVEGTISFTDVTLRYSADQPLVIKGVSFDIRNREKIGIVGRTGSGKSSLMQALLRMVEPSSGGITVDGIDVLKIGLFDLRSRLAIIPQDPVLFSGTFRSNLDPFNEYTDIQLWDAISRAGLKSLEGKIQEGGENLSVGQKQLLCLARAMLKTPVILIMDEATANVDYDTDAFIQKALRSDFKQATIITIAHRLNTIIDYDRVLVLDSGFNVKILFNGGRNRRSKFGSSQGISKFF